jgi:hypothetical protein
VPDVVARGEEAVPTRFSADTDGVLTWRSELYRADPWISLVRGDVALDQAALENLARAVLPALEAPQD